MCPTPCHRRPERGRRRRSRRAHADRGSIDVSIEMLFGLIATLLVALLLFEAIAYWHARNVFDDAAAEGARIAAAFDGSCTAGIATALESVRRHAGSWADDAAVTCSDGPTVVVTVSGRTPGALAGAMGFTARVTETAPKEG